jgi:hypothetical protein
MTVLDSVGIVREAHSLFEVTSQSEREYIVDFDTPDGARCLCDDHKYRQRDCKHIWRVRYETGRAKIPTWVSPEDVDDGLGAFVDGEPQWSR